MQGKAENTGNGEVEKNSYKVDLVREQQDLVKWVFINVQFPLIQ